MPADLETALRERGILHPFPIQAATLPDSLAGRDVCGRAPTGSGKTLAFGLALAVNAGRADARRPRALVLAPTRELAEQIRAELAPLLQLRGGRVGVAYGGTNINAQIKTLARGLEVLVACPGRLTDLVNRGACVLSDVDLVVIDEADRMADMGFLPEVRRLLDQVSKSRQTLLFSATLDGDVDVLIKRYQRNPVRHDVTPADRSDSTTHLFLDTERSRRVDAVRDLVTTHGSSVVFCRTKHGADRLARQLARAGVTAVAMHGNRSQAQRERALAAFSSGRCDALIATDVAARGIHVDSVGCVIHFDVPADTKAYIHRSGRTGRAGAPGVVVSLVGAEDRAAVKQIKRALGQAPAPAPRSAAVAAPGGRRRRPRRRAA